MIVNGAADLRQKLSSKNMTPSSSTHTAAVCLTPSAKPASSAEA